MLDKLNLMAALSIDRLDLSLRHKHLIILCAFSTLTILPAALWAGALTPIDTSVLREPFRVRSPAYSNETYHGWSQRWLNYVGLKVRNDLGMFFYAASLHRSGFLHSDGAATFSLDGSSWLHLKNDSSNFTYHSRSHGIGSLIGLEENDLNLSEDVLSYDFREIGYLSKILCIYNQSSAFGLTLLELSDKAGISETYVVDGAGPFRKRALTMAGFGGEAIIVATAWYEVHREATPINE